MLPRGKILPGVVADAFSAVLTVVFEMVFHVINSIKNDFFKDLILSCRIDRSVMKLLVRFYFRGVRGHVPQRKKFDSRQP